MVTVAADAWTMAMGLHGGQPFAERMTYNFEDQTMFRTAQLPFDDTTWDDDLQITYRRA